MTEEEKKAIETLQYLCSDDCINKDIIKTIVKLIEKLQKENEELKEDNLGIREENIKLVNCHISYERYTGLDFLLPDKFKYAIPKDKIREKIKELEKQSEEIKNFYKGTYACLDEYLNAKSKIQGYNELLEEG